MTRRRPPSLVLPRSLEERLQRIETRLTIGEAIDTAQRDLVHVVDQLTARGVKVVALDGVRTIALIPLEVGQ